MQTRMKHLGGKGEETRCENSARGGRSEAGGLKKVGRFWFAGAGWRDDGPLAAPSGPAPPPAARPPHVGGAWASSPGSPAARAASQQTKANSDRATNRRWSIRNKTRSTTSTTTTTTSAKKEPSAAQHSIVSDRRRPPELCWALPWRAFIVCVCVSVCVCSCVCACVCLCVSVREPDVESMAASEYFATSVISQWRSVLWPFRSPVDRAADRLGRKTQTAHKQPLWPLVKLWTSFQRCWVANLSFPNLKWSFTCPILNDFFLFHHVICVQRKWSGSISIYSVQMIHW